MTGAKFARLVGLAADGPSGEHHHERRPPPAGATTPPRTLTIGIATHGNFDAVQLTIAALRLGHTEALDRIALLVIDTDPGGPDAWSLKSLEWEVPDLRYVPAADLASTALAKDRIFQEASSDWVLCMEPQTLLMPGALSALLDFAERNEQCADLVQGPQLHDDLTQVSTQWLPIWGEGRFGLARFEEPGEELGGEPFAIPMQSLDLFACRRDVWPGCNRRLRGPSYLEGYLHQKFLRQGGRTCCLPGLRWVRRTARSTDVPSPESWLDHFRNYLLEWGELGLPSAVVAEQFRDLLDPGALTVVQSQWEAERNNPFLAFDGLFCINLDERPDRWERMSQRFRRLGIPDGLVRRVPGIATANNHVGCALSHRRVYEIAHAEGLETILVFEDDTVFLEGAHWVLRQSLRELAQQDWCLLYLGTFPSLKYPLVRGCRNLEVANGLLGAHAVAYKRQTYEDLLDVMPADIEAMTAWAERHPIDGYLADTLTDGVFRVSPMIAAQESLLHCMPVDLRDQYVVDWDPERPAADGALPDLAAPPSPTETTSDHRAPWVTARYNGHSRALPTVTAVMITGRDEQRRPLARLTALAFEQQTYSAAELLVINQGREPLLTEPLDRTREIMAGESLVVGALRNLAWDLTTSHLMATWDDSDVHHPERIAQQVAAFKGWPVMLQNQLVVNPFDRSGFAAFYKFGFASSLLWPRACATRYTEDPLRSDIHFLNGLSLEYDRITRLDNLPSLYVRVIRGPNTSNFGNIQVDEPTADERQLLDHVMASRNDTTPWTTELDTAT